MRRINILLVVALATATLLMTGCTSDERLVDVATEAAERQAEQNRQIAYQNHQLAESTKELVSLQHDLQAEQTELASGWDKLFDQRHDLADEYRHESKVASVISFVGCLLLCLLPLLVVLHLLGSFGQKDGEDAVTEMLLDELIAESPKLASAAKKEHKTIKNRTRASLLPAAKSATDFEDD